MTALEAPLTGRLPEPRWRTAFGSVEICGKYAAVAMRARERAWSKRSRAAASDWFACSSCSSYRLSVSSPNICHQAPLGIGLSEQLAARAAVSSTHQALLPEPQAGCIAVLQCRLEQRRAAIKSNR